MCIAGVVARIHSNIERYVSMSIYRKIYEKHYGSIPKDSKGRTYDIHHINGNHNDNRIENLIALSVQEHYNIHYKQGDWFACYLMARTMNFTPKEISELAKKTNLDRIKNGNHNFLGENHPMRVNSKNGTHHFYGQDFIKKQYEQGRNANQIKFSCIFCKKVFSFSNFNNHTLTCNKNPHKIKMKCDHSKRHIIYVTSLSDKKVYDIGNFTKKFMKNTNLV